MNHERDISTIAKYVLAKFLEVRWQKMQKRREKIHSISDSFAMPDNLLKGSSGCLIITAYLWLRFPWGFPLAWSRRILECSKRLPGIPGKLRPTDSRCCRGMFRRISFLCRVKWRRAEYQNLCTSNKTNLIRRHPHCPRPIRWGQKHFNSRLARWQIHRMLRLHIKFQHLWFIRRRKVFGLQPCAVLSFLVQSSEFFSLKKGLNGISCYV